MSVPVSVLVLAFLLGGCSGQPTVSRPLDANLEQILSGQVLLGEQADQLPLPEDHVFALSDEMRNFLRVYVPQTGNANTRLQRLLYALMHQGVLGMRYDPMKTYTAQDAFLFQQGNCLTFSVLFTALARELGLRVQFNEVDIPPSWGMQESGSFVFYRHVNVLVNGRSRHAQIVDLNLKVYDEDYRQRIISDRETEAQYYNNRAVEYLDQENKQEAFRYFRKALELNPKAGYIWSNLGTLYRRHNHFPEAEDAFRHALYLAPNDRVVTSNLARLYQQQGKLELAASYRERVKRFRLRNPYFRYTLAQVAFENGELEVALEHINSAIRRQKREVRFYELAAQIYQTRGEIDSARAQLIRASDLSVDQSVRARYQQQLKLLVAE